MLEPQGCPERGVVPEQDDLAAHPPYPAGRTGVCVALTPSQAPFIDRISISHAKDPRVVGASIIQPILLMGKLRPRERALEFSSPQSCVLHGQLLSGG